ncbi:MAG: maltose ABC transporter substrate-binding protein, partial [Candidatus Carbobacillus sp.]|nr:maltose ABC transporter substrate-binding protein [Candidatus Carbobacillus sp.]
MHRSWRSLLMLLAIFVFMSVTACGGKTETPNTTTPSTSTETPSTTSGEKLADEVIKPEEGASLVLWESSGAVGEWAKYVAQKFEEKYGVPVTYEEVSHTDAPEKLKTDGPAGLGADVFSAPHDHLGELVSGGLVLENMFPNEFTNETYMPTAIAGTSYDGQLYGYPTSIETYALFYNKDLVKDLPKTWDEMLDQAKAMTDTKKNTYGFMMEVANFYYVYSLIGGYGGYVFGDNNTNPNDIGLNNAGSVKAGQLLQKMHKEVLPLKVEDITYDAKEGLFKDGKLTYNVNGPWAVDDYRKAGVNFGLVPLPVLDNGNHPTSFSGIRAFYVNAYTKYPNAAALLAKFAASEEMQLKLFEMTGMLPVYSALLDHPSIKANDITSGFLEQAQYAVPMP